MRYQEVASMRHMTILASIVWLVIGSAASAQFAHDDRLEQPKTPNEFWRAITFELNTGKYDAAAYYLKGFLAANPTDEQLVQLERDEGMAAILRLRSIGLWSSDAKVQDEARKNAETVIQKVTQALEKQLGNQQRINKFIANLRASPEESAFAVRELQRSGARGVPAIVAALRADTDPNTQSAILNVIPRLPEDTVAPFLASIDMPDARLRYQILQSLGQRPDFQYLAERPETNPLPTLDYLSASPKQSPEMRKLARELITKIRPIAEGEIRPAKLELVDAALRFHHHQEHFVNSKSVPIWRWQDNALQLTPSTASQAEEYLGLRYARWALDLAPADLAAQVAFLSIAADKAFERIGVDASLAKLEPAVHDLLATASVEALIATLDQGIIDRRTNVVLGATQSLSQRKEVRAGAPERCRLSVLQRALDYPDRRVQIAAAEALVRMPSCAGLTSQAKIVEILRRALSAKSEVIAAKKPRVIIGHYNQSAGQALADDLNAAGFETVVVRTGHEIMRRLNQAGDIDAVVVDADIPYTPLPDLLASLRTDIHWSALPVRVVFTPISRADFQSTMMETRLGRSTPQTMLVRQDDERAAVEAEKRVRALTENMRGVALLKTPVSPDVWKESFGMAEAVSGPPISPEVRKRFAAKANELFRYMALHCNYDLTPADRAIRQAMRSNELAIDAIETASRLPGIEAQIDLAAVVLDAARPAEVRTAAAEGLARHIQKFGRGLPPAAGTALIRLAAETADPMLRGRVADAVGILTIEGPVTGQRLRQYNPPQPGELSMPTQEKPSITEPAEKKPEAGSDDK